MTGAAALVLSAAVALSSAFEFKRRAVPAWAVIVPLLAVLVLAMAIDGMGDATEGFLAALLGSVACAAVWAIFKKVGKMEWSDVGLMGTVGAAFRLPGVPSALMLISITGGLLAVIVTIASRLKKRAPAASGVATPALRVPYSIAVGLGSVWAWWWMVTDAAAET